MNEIKEIKDLPLFTTILVCDPFMKTPIIEAVITRISPSGKYVYFTGLGFVSHWREIYDCIVLEVLHIPELKKE